MKATKPNQSVQSRRELFDLLQVRMRTTYSELREYQLLSSESNVVKTYLFEVDGTSGKPVEESSGSWLADLLKPTAKRVKEISVYPKGESGFFQVDLLTSEGAATLFLDTSTDDRFWIGYSVSSSVLLDWWLERVIQQQRHVDYVWLWPSFLEVLQERGEPRGFGLDYDYRRFEDADGSTYLKMQLYGGALTRDIYELLKGNQRIGNKVVLSKVRMKELANPDEHDSFALQSVKYTGKFTTTGTDLATHQSTLSYTRRTYASVLHHIEDQIALRWKVSEAGAATLEGYAVHFLPDGFEVPVERFCARVLDGTAPFRLLGFPRLHDVHWATAETVDLHTGGTLGIEVHPDAVTVYLPEGTCGNTIARLYTNLQHYYDARFTVEADNGDNIFWPDTR